MALPYPGMDYVPFDVLTAEELDQMVANIESLSDGSGLENGSVTPSKLDLGGATAFVATSEFTTSGSYTDLTTTTDAVTVNISSNGIALVILQTNITNITVNVTNRASVLVSGANSIAAGDNAVPTLVYNSSSTSTANDHTKIAHRLMTGLSPGLTTFKMKYLTGAGSAGYFSYRSITVVPL